MYMVVTRLLGAAAVAVGLAISAHASQAFEVSGYVAAEARLFAHSPLDARQRRHSGSVVLQPEFYHAVSYTHLTLPTICSV